MKKRDELASYALAVISIASACLYAYEGTTGQRIHPWSALVTWMWMPAAALAIALWLQSIWPPSANIPIRQKWPRKAPPLWFRLILIMSVLLGIVGYGPNGILG